MTVATQIITDSQAELNEELRSYAERSPVFIVQPTMGEAIAAIEPHFPELVDKFDSAQELLDAVGLPVIVDISPNYKPKRISWSIVTSESDAEQQLKGYEQDTLNAIRTSLGINHHWIFLVPSKSLSIYDKEALVEGSIDFYCDEEPNCWVFDRFREL